jgi:hypothetical protein
MAKKVLGNNGGKKQVVTRKVIMINKSHYICIPMEFVTRHGIRPGDNMALTMGEILKMIPMDKEG